MPVASFSGQVDIAVAFNIGWAVRLDQVLGLVNAHPGAAYGRTPRAPLEVTRDVEAFDCDGFRTADSVALTIYDFGAVSARFSIPVVDVRAEALVRLSALLSGNVDIHNRARHVVARLLDEIVTAVQEPALGDTAEDYAVFRLVLPEGAGQSVHAFAASHARTCAQIIRAEVEELSDQSIRQALERMFSCYAAEAVMIGWCSTVVLTESNDAPRLSSLLLAPLELANTQLLEFRYFFQQLDALSSTSEAALLRGKISAKEYLPLDKLMLGLSEMFGLITSGLEVFDNERLADVHEMAGVVFRFPQKIDIVQAELAHLSNVTERIDQKHDVTHSHRLEVIVIVLILIEVVRAFLH